tara:strand:+ start:151 stop:771 length:621 start_codon:yes stop_codon:yes gene_type:complete
MTQVYTSPYANNLGKMNNSEVVALAKNRFTDSDTMLAISKHWYRLGKEYLASNPNITPEAAQELWNHRGYVFKSLLLSNGSIKLKKKEYTEFYRKYFKNNSRSHWRMMQAFFGQRYWHTADNENNTPGELLEEIYGDLGEEELSRTYNLERFITHKNCTLDLALRIGTMKTPEHQMRYYADSFERLRQKAMLKVAEITKREGADSR